MKTQYHLSFFFSKIMWKKLKSSIKKVYITVINALSFMPSKQR